MARGHPGEVIFSGATLSRVGRSSFSQSMTQHAIGGQLGSTGPRDVALS